MIVLASFILAVVLLVNIAIKLIDPGVNTNTVLSESNVEFPSFTVCSANQYKKSYLDAHPELKFWLASINPEYEPLIYKDLQEKKDIEGMAFDLNGLDIDKMLREAAPSLNETIMTLIWADHFIPIESVFKTVVTEQGYCHTFLVDTFGVVLIEEEGMGSGIRIQLYSDPNEYTFNTYGEGSEGFVVC